MQQLKEQNMKQAEEFERKLKEKQMLVWKTEMSQSQLVDQITRLSSEVERLKKIEGLNESIARLPNVCLQDISSEKEAERAKSSALHQALDKVRGKEFDDVVKEIDDLQDKSKNAYIRLYEKVGEDIGLHFLDKLDYLGSKETEADKMISGKYSTA
jgi:predicted nuclease with TOPRIM domain